MLSCLTMVAILNVCIIPKVRTRSMFALRIMIEGYPKIVLETSSEREDMQRKQSGKLNHQLLNNPMSTPFFFVTARRIRFFRICESYNLPWRNSTVPAINQSHIELF